MADVDNISEHVSDSDSDDHIGDVSDYDDTLKTKRKYGGSFKYYMGPNSIKTGLQHGLSYLQ